MNKNQLLETNGLVPLIYEPLIKTIRDMVKDETNPLFEFNTKDNVPYLQIKVDRLAQAVATKTIQSLPLSVWSGTARSASVNVDDIASFSQVMTQLYTTIDVALERAITKSSYTNKQEALEALTTTAAMLDQSQNRSSRNPKIGLRYPFIESRPMTRQRLRVTSLPTATPLLRLHKLKISVEKVRNFETAIVDALTRFGSVVANGDEDAELVVNQVIENMQTRSDSDLYRLYTLVDNETIGRLKREGKVQYIEYLVKTLPTYQNDNIKEPEGQLLADFADRLRLIDSFMLNDELADGEVTIGYNGCQPFNLQVGLARSDVFDALPFIANIAGTLGEITEGQTGNRTFHLGLQLKFGGKVTREEDVPLSFDYHLSLINPHHDRHTRELRGDRKDQFHHRILVRACVYYIALSQLGNFNHNPLEAFISRFLPRLASGNQDQQRAVLEEIVQELSDPYLHSRVERLIKWVQQRLKSVQSSFPSETRTRYLSIQRSILAYDLDDIVDRYSLFQNVFLEENLQGLRYLRFGDIPVDPEALATLPVTFTIDSHHFYNNGEQESFEMNYNIDGQRMLPLLLVPTGTPLTEHIERPASVIVVYSPDTLDHWHFQEKYTSIFLYKFVYLTLLYLTLRILLKDSETSPKPFIPILRFHSRPISEQNMQEAFLRVLTKVIAHTLNQGEALASAQGFDISDVIGTKEPYAAYKLKNALSSLYSVLPKRFKLPRAVHMNQLAIVVISTRECDRLRSGSQGQVLLTGEIIGIKCNGTTAQIRQLATLSEPCDRNELYTTPVYLRDILMKLYGSGYHDILYVAKPPYTQKLNITGASDDLYFMRPTLLNYLTASCPGLRLYPIFFDMYSVRKLAGRDKYSQSLYIDDTGELQSLVRDDQTSRQLAVFYNLFNGRDFGSGVSEGFYNRVISYATLLNVQPGVLEDRHIREGLLYAGQRKNDILTLLTLLHFARYEAAPMKSRDITLKLNPYATTIGDTPLVALAEQKHTDNKTNWNMLAFLTLVRKVLNR